MDISLRSSPVHFILWGIIAVVMIRIVLVFAMGMMPQDAYYYLYSEHLSLSYFDHPPMIAWLLRTFSIVFGKTVLGVKLTDFILTTGTIFVFYRLAQKFHTGFMVDRSMYLILSTMLISILSLVTTPDVPLMLFWSLSVLFLYRAIESNQTRDWLLAGFMTGLAFDSKYTALMILVGLFGYLLTYAPKRHLLRRKGPYLAVMIFVLTIMPVLIWNFQNDWISIKFQSSDRVSSMEVMNIQLKYFFGNIGTQMFLLLPALYIFLLVALIRQTFNYFKSRCQPDGHHWFLWWFCAPMVFGFMFLSMIYWVKLNWAMPAYITGILLAVNFIPGKWVRIQVLLSVVFHFAFLIQVFYYPFSIRSDDTWWGWPELAAHVKQIHTRYPDSFIFSDDGYKTSAELSFFLDQKIYSGNVIGKDGLQFSIIDPELHHLKNKNALYIDSEKRFDDINPHPMPRPELSEYFESVQQMEPIIIYNDSGEPERKFLVYYLTNYKGS